MTDLPNAASLGLDKAPADTRVVVAMSGGVDSSVVAAMLVRAGYDVIGITLQLYDHGAATAARKGSCCAGRDIHDARSVAARLDIPHYVLDYENRFRDKVILPFAASYMAGETPIPCVSCNAAIKFADLFDTAKDLGADVLATGHYVASRRASDGYALYQARDKDRDQSYFLYSTTKAQLDFLRFPLGDMTKPDVRALAQTFGLVVADKADSQDICFVPTGRYSDLIARLRPDALEAGDIVHVDGRVLGRHRGIVHFTVGQRRGLGLANPADVKGEPLYVIRLDAAEARVVVGPREALATAEVLLRDVNWIGPGRFEDAVGRGLEVAVRLRSTRAPVPALLTLEAREGEFQQAVVRLLRREDGVSPGQACVFYDATEDQARVLGGGIIASTIAATLDASAINAPAASRSSVRAVVA